MARSAARSRGFVCVPTFTIAPSITGTPQAADIGARLTFEVTATNALNPAKTASGASLQTATVIA
ncbi:hypothetical protein U1872_12455 [Sphingomonas sp. RB3P16]|uniref:hypothetical protein n=1 Tax=Parasphingomonas frigoris TaxID=3096163 RepID=UPI002FC9E714